MEILRIEFMQLKNFYSSNKADLYKIGVWEIIIMFTLLFFIYTMPIQVHRFSVSLFGRLIILLSIISVSYYNVIYGITLTLLFIAISELGRFEEGYKSEIIGNIKGKYREKKRNLINSSTKIKSNLTDKAEGFARKHKL